MAYLLDTNVVSEVRKRNRCARPVAEWFSQTEPADVFLSVIVVTEIRQGIEALRTRDPQTAKNLDRWLQNLRATFAAQILPITVEVADVAGRLCPGQPLPPEDRLIAGTALHHGLIVATRNTQDFLRAGVVIFNPWDYKPKR